MTESSSKIESPNLPAQIAVDGLDRRGVDPETPIDFQVLSAGRHTVYIELNGELYRLSRTRHNRLILTK